MSDMGGVTLTLLGIKIDVNVCYPFSCNCPRKRHKPLNCAPSTRHAGHCWRSRDELISDVLLWTPTHGRAKAGRPARTYIQQLCEDTECCPEDLPEVMNDREKWRERVWDIRATSTTWWWWWWWFSCGYVAMYATSLALIKQLILEKENSPMKTTRCRTSNSTT